MNAYVIPLQNAASELSLFFLGWQCLILTAAKTDGVVLEDETFVGEALERIHTDAYNWTLSYNQIVIYKLLTDETYFIYKLVEKSLTRVEANKDFSRMTNQEKQSLAVSNHMITTRRLVRRSMLRNGCCIRWGKTVIQDEFVKVFIMPTAKFLYFSIFR